MSYFLRIFWMITLLVFVSGCSGYQVACRSLSEVPDETDLNMDPETEEICDLEIGENIRINLLDGEQIVGDIQFISPHEIVVNDEDNYFLPRTFTAAQISLIERPSSSSSTGQLLS